MHISEMQDSTELYQPVRIMVTGGCGFIAGHVIDRLLYESEIRENLEMILNVDKFGVVSTYCRAHSDLHRKYFFRKADVNDTSKISTFMRQFRIDTVIHMAAETHVDQSSRHSLLCTDSNVRGTHSVLQACLENKDTIRRIIHVSTDEVYGGNSEYVCRNEMSITLPTNPYAASKAAAEQYVQAYMLSFNLPVIITRGVNVYGPRQFPEKVIPKFLVRTMRGLPIEIHGTGLASRHFLHVSDVARAYEAILLWGSVGEIYNIGSDEELTVKDLAEKIRNLFPNSAPPVEFVEDRHFDDRRYYIDSGKLRALGWCQCIPFEMGLQLTCEWYKTTFHNTHPWNKCVDKFLTAHPPSE